MLPPVESSFAPLASLFSREQQAGRSMALAIVLDTAGSTYSKRGALLLIAADGEYAGLLSGGCLEGDLRSYAQQVIETGIPQRVRYDMRGADDLLWGLGAGCEGAMDIFVVRVGPANRWQPLQHLHEAWRAARAAGVAVVVECERDPARRGEILLLDGDALPADHAEWLHEAGATLFAFAPAVPPRLLLLGAGPDALPVWRFARDLGWRVTLYDHRPAYADAARAAGAEQVLCARAEELCQSLHHAALTLDGFAAAVVMSHHLHSDLAYLRQLAASRIPYVGLLGPAPRRDKLREQMGSEVLRLDGRLRSPVGLALGGRSSAAIALAIVAEIQAFLHGRAGGAMARHS